MKNKILWFAVILPALFLMSTSGKCIGTFSIDSSPEQFERMGRHPPRCLTWKDPRGTFKATQFYEQHVNQILRFWITVTGDVTGNGNPHQVGDEVTLEWGGQTFEKRIGFPANDMPGGQLVVLVVHDKEHEKEKRLEIRKDYPPRVE